MNPAELRPPTALDERYDRVVAALTRRLADHARTRQQAAAPPFCGHDFLVPLLHPDLLNAAAVGHESAI